MFLDSGNIISDETFCTQSQNYGGKCSRIFGRISLPLSGDGNSWPLVSHDPSGSCDTSWRMTARMSRPVSLFSSGLPWCILMASLILLLDTWSSLSNIMNILASFRLHLWPISSRCSPTAVLGCRPAVSSRCTCIVYCIPIP